GSTALFGWPPLHHALDLPTVPPLDTSYRSPSQRKGADVIDPFFSLCGMPDQQQIIDRSSHREMLRDNQHTCTGCCRDKRGKVLWHRFPVMGDQDTPVVCRAPRLPDPSARQVQPPWQCENL